MGGIKRNTSILAMETITRKWDWAAWETPDQRPFFRGETCNLCENAATHIAMAEDDDDAILIRARCDSHFNQQTQKKWLKDWRKKNTN